MPQNLSEQLLQRIVRLSADGDSQREVARMHKRNFAMQSRVWPTTSEEAWRFDENLHAAGRPSTAPNGQTEQLHLGSSYLGSGCQFEPFGDGFWPPDIGIGVQPDVLGSLWSTGNASVSGGGGTECGTTANGDTVSSVMSPGFPYHSDGRVRVRRRQGERLVDVCVQPNDGKRGPSVMVWGAIHHGGGVGWSWWMEPWTGIGTSRSWGIKCCHGRRGGWM